MHFPLPYKRLLKNSELRQVILDVLPTIAARTSWKRGIIFYILQNLDDKEKQKYAKVLFVKSTNPRMSEVNYGNIIESLLCIGISNEKMLNLIANNMENIIVDDFKFPETLESIARIMKSAKGKLPEDEYFRLIDLIDTALVNNIENLMNKEDDNYEMKSGYTSESFDGFNKFQTAIRERGIDVFNSGLYIGEENMEECKKAAEKYFGTCDVRTLITMMYGRYGKDRTDVIAAIIEELQERCHTDSFEIIGKGHTSTAILVGEYIVKVAKNRYIKEMPNDPRILQPIIRQRLPGKKMNEVKPSTDARIKDKFDPFIEVQNRVETNWMEGLTEEEIEEELYKIYKEMRDRGNVFADITPENVGRLIKENRPNYEFRDIDGKYIDSSDCKFIDRDIRPTEEATGLKGEIPSEQVLGPGELVVLDTDFVYPEEKFNPEWEVGWPKTNARRKRFEKRYDEEEKQKEDKDSGRD